MASSKLTVPILLKWGDIESYMEQHDIVKVVRCKDCKYSVITLRCDTDGNRHEQMFCRLHGEDISNDWFCADGEMRK